MTKRIVCAIAVVSLIAGTLPSESRSHLRGRQGALSRRFAGTGNHPDLSGN